VATPSCFTSLAANPSSMSVSLLEHRRSERSRKSLERLRLSLSLPMGIRLVVETLSWNMAI